MDRDIAVALPGHERHQHPGPGLSLMAAFNAAPLALIAHLAVEVAPFRVDLMAAGRSPRPIRLASCGIWC